MCGRYALRTSTPEIARILGLEEPAVDVESSRARFNIAPTQPVLICRQPRDRPPRLGRARWGLIPHWAKDDKLAYRMINARAETLAERPAYRTPLRHRRCLVPADGYYEWRPGAGGAPKQPYFIHLRDHRPFCFAGLWERWDKGGVDPVDSCTIVTTEANEIGRDVHPRMPVILDPDDYAAWLDPRVTEPDAVLPLLRPYRAEAMALYPVSTYVNRPGNDDERCVTPLPAPAPPPGRPPERR